VSDPVLSVEDLQTRFRTRNGTVHAVDGVSFEVGSDEILGVVGESGCGKSATALSVMGLQDPGEIVGGAIRFDGSELTDSSAEEWRRVRGDGMSMVFQNPESTLNPVFTVGEQIAESVKLHEGASNQRLREYVRVPFFGDGGWSDPLARAEELLDEVGIPNPGLRADAYPHELSGGLRQRAMLAIALAADPDLLVADEPTTALDTTTQAQILAKLREINHDRETAMVVISHDLGVVAELCDRVLVMYAGRVMERGTTERVLTNPSHPYTQALLRCTTRGVDRGERLDAIEGEVPDLLGGTDGCPFAPRCRHATDACRRRSIPTNEVEPGHEVACDELDAVPDGPAVGVDGSRNGKTPQGDSDDDRVRHAADGRTADE
jgi:peptide/nickel transport system ATP-binding protein